MRAPRPHIALVVAVVALVLVLNAALQTGVGGQRGGAQASGYGVLTSTGAGLGPATASVDGTADRSRQVAGVADPLGTVGAVSVEAGAHRAGGRSRALASARASGLSLLGGRVTIASVTGGAEASAGAADASGAVTSFAVSGVSVDGAPVPAGPGTVLDVPGAGSVAIGETSGVGTGEVRLSLVRVSGAGGGTMVVGHVEVDATPGPTAVSATPVATPSPDPEAADPPAPRTSRPARRAPATTPRRTAPARPAPPVRVAPLPARPPATRAPASAPTAAAPARPVPRALPGTPGVAPGAAFPVAGDYSFSDDYGAPRADTIWHQGNDVFADLGTPVVAVADGTLSKVGWNTLGGNRLWLTDAAGTSYYYAHLSAYAPIAREGATVAAGEVIGYVGNTGDAAATPPHVHFEVHPGGIEAASVDPYPFLRSWSAGLPGSYGAPAAAAAFAATPAVPLDAGAGAVVVGVAPEQDTPPRGGDGRAEAVR